MALTRETFPQMWAMLRQISVSYFKCVDENVRADFAKSLSSSLIEAFFIIFCFPSRYSSLEPVEWVTRIRFLQEVLFDAGEYRSFIHLRVHAQQCFDTVGWPLPASWDLYQEMAMIRSVAPNKDRAQKFLNGPISFED